MPVFKVTIVITAFGEFDNLADAEQYLGNIENLDEILSRSEDGDMIDGASVINVHHVQPDDVAAELIAIGNDGTFFDLGEF